MRKKKNYIFLGLSVFLLLIAALTFFTFSSPKFSSKKSAELETLEKVKVATGNGKLVLDNEDTNALINLYFKNKLSSGPLKVKDIYSDIEGSNISLFAPFSINNINLTVSTNGTLSYENNKYVYKLTSIKLGKLPIPKGLLFSMAKKYNSSSICFINGEIQLSNILPLKINELKVKDNLLLVSLVTSKENPNATAKGGNNSSKNIVTELFRNMLNIDTASNTSSGTNSSSNANSNNNSSSNNGSSNSVQKPSPEADNNKKLRLLNSQLITAAMSLKSSQEIKVMNMMETAVQRVISNPSYNFSADINETQKYYNTLTKDQKTHVKQAILSNVDIQNAMDLQAMVTK
ncbi:hypothetical protein [Candidatus Clostridium radicumherbarum]|uniref:DUF2140 domain-containing protein n=1 Tax=Candidatus Clostridium radicumherbarum TaxID=3381662 RepID=A0ABW8TUY1_9CLOT